MPIAGKRALLDTSPLRGGVGGALVCDTVCGAPASLTLPHKGGGSGEGKGEESERAVVLAVGARR